MSAAEQHGGAGRPALQHQQRVRPGRVPQRLGRGHRVVADERQCGRADEQLLEPLEAGAVRGEAGERVLVHLVLGAALAECAASVASWPTFSPRYSVTNTALAAVSFTAISSTRATFSARGFSISMRTSSHVVSWRLAVGASTTTIGRRRRPCVGRAPRSAGPGPITRPNGRTDGLRRATVWIGRCTIPPQHPAPPPDPANSLRPDPGPLHTLHRSPPTDTPTTTDLASPPPRRERGHLEIGWAARQRRHAARPDRRHVPSTMAGCRHAAGRGRRPSPARPPSAAWMPFSVAVNPDALAHRVVVAERESVARGRHAVSQGRRARTLRGDRDGSPICRSSW